MRDGRGRPRGALLRKAHTLDGGEPLGHASVKTSGATGRKDAMMGSKARVFAPVERLTLEELVPPDHFYRHLERVLDLRFVRALVAPYYAAAGRPSIDPVVFFKLQLLMFFEGI